MNIKIEDINSDKIAIFSSDTLVFPDKKSKKEKNRPLSDEIEKWACIQNKNFFVATFLAHSCKGTKKDLENILLYNLNDKNQINEILKTKSKIIIQGLDNLRVWPDKDLLYYYFYYVSDDLEDIKRYLLYECNYDEIFEIKKDDFEKFNPKEIKENYSKYMNHTVVNCNTKFCLKIKVNPKNFFISVDKLKGLVDKIVTFANSLNIIAVPEEHKIVNKNGHLNPTDALLYMCEIEIDDSMNDIQFCVCPICNCNILFHKVKNFPGFSDVK
jgi:hypothetical protein